jgi:hypothetical protein
MDGDGMPDGWEVEYGLDPITDDMADNPDNDPHSNIQEYIAGTDPSDPASYLCITNAVPLGSDFLIEWASVSGRLYTTFWSANLTNGFELLESGIEVPQHGSTDTVHGAQNSGFYKLEVELND